MQLCDNESMNTHTRNQQKEWLDLKEAEAEFSISKRSLWGLISSGKLPAYKPFKRKTLVRRSEMEKLLESTRVSDDLGRIVDEVVAEVRCGRVSK